ncbi:hypothetical protein H5183_18310 [Pseudoalteromonas sp. SR44-8]|uniref:hypothetical protein n=1 Tax=Pseudoalteromonas sp. SR44-8 TaxID=2760933 RepID=UPI0016010E03|nr:hypothetical protein [Pseudoalteromonas sp. SR44-8]MBB1303295.1 hypothetical protein [Pseudoalteromonas sp. SR44-8]
MLTHQHRATFKMRWQATRLQVSNKYQSKFNTEINFNTVGVKLADAPTPHHILKRGGKPLAYK